MTYRERPSVGGAVVWTAVAEPGEARILPDGCMDLMWDGVDVMIAGPDTEVFVYSRRPGATLTGLRFAPGVAPRLIGAPAHQFVNARVPLDAVWPGADVARLRDELCEAKRVSAILEALARRADPDARTQAIAAGARRGVPVSAIAEDANLSARQLQRLCRDAFGYGAKTLARILRFGRALDLARAGREFALVAADAGYADQAHFTREVREFAGQSPAQLVGRSAARST